ncbi:hypothetical protein GQX74_006142 [Glossina fuscipes]|nr:hypothetical protein GQX74_006142 [Glossina fuscipes]
MTSNAVTLMIMRLAISSALENHENLTELQRRTAQSNAFVTTGYGNSCILEIVDRLTSQCHRTAELVMAMTMTMAMAPEDTFSHLSYTGKRIYVSKCVHTQTNIVTIEELRFATHSQLRLYSSKFVTFDEQLFGYRRCNFGTLPSTVRRNLPAIVYGLAKKITQFMLKNIVEISKLLTKLPIIKLGLYAAIDDECIRLRDQRSRIERERGQERDATSQDSKELNILAYVKEETSFKCFKRNSNCDNNNSNNNNNGQAATAKQGIEIHTAIETE